MPERIQETTELFDATRNEEMITSPLLHTAMRNAGINLPHDINLATMIGGPIAAAVWAAIVGRERYEDIETRVCVDIQNLGGDTTLRVHRAMLLHEERNGYFPGEAQRRLLTTSWPEVRTLIRWMNEMADRRRNRTGGVDRGPGGGGGGGNDESGGGGGANGGAGHDGSNNDGNSGADESDEVNRMVLFSDF